MVPSSEGQRSQFFYGRSPYVIGRAIYIFHPVVCSFFFFLSTWCGLSANFGCRSETCCTRLAENTGRKKVTKNRHLGTIAQLCRAISSQLRHISTIGKKLDKQQNVLHLPPQYGELRPSSGWDRSGSLAALKPNSITLAGSELVRS